MPYGTIDLNDGYKLPAIAFGTGSALYGRDATDAVEQALDAGFDHIDTAATYKNEESVGVAIKESGLRRDELYITTKYDGGDIQQSIRDSLKKLGIQYVDLYLIHFPSLVEGELEKSWREFERIKEDGLAKSIGVSNFTLENLQDLVRVAKILPSVNQIRFHPYNYVDQKGAVEFAAKHGIVTAAYSGLTPITRAPGGAVDKPVAAAAKRLGATPAQVLLKWIRAKGVVVVTTTSRKARLVEYLEAADLNPLTKEEIEDIDTAGAKGAPSVRAKGARVALIVLLGLGYYFIRHKLAA